MRRKVSTTSGNNPSNNSYQWFWVPAVAGTTSKFSNFLPVLRGLIALLKSMTPLDEEFPQVDVPVPTPECV
jgi:hypothetical protein